MAKETTGEDKTIILVVDDDGDIRIALEMLLTYEGFDVWTAKNGEEALARLDQAIAGDGPRPDLVLTDLKMPGLDGIELLGAIAERDAAPPVVLISGHGDVATAVDAMNHGARNFLEKPLDESRVLITLRGVLREDRLRQENTGLKQQLFDRWELVGTSSAMETLRDQVRRVAASDAAVLITGENGTGKEVVARNLHLAGPRAAGPFITVNCAAIPAELIESELFGHEKGSFTGAIDRRTGHFEAAGGGTLFLDEIGDMPLAAQAKVLRALETHEITRVGDNSPIPVDIRVLAATNTDLGQAVEDTSFRMDLFYRLNVVPLVVPPLRDRLEDVPALAQLFLDRLAERTGHRSRSLSKEAGKLLGTLDYPGNVRQLRNLIEGASVFAEGDQIGVAELEEVLGAGVGVGRPARAQGEDPFQAETFEEFKNQSEALFFRQKLAENDDNVKRTAERLGMQRSHIYKKLSRYGLR
jgi:two-component system nitrogen regulation response regulator NtrX